MPVIPGLYAWIAIEADGNEGICSYAVPGLGMTNLVALNLDAIQRLRPLAEGIAKDSGARVVLRAFGPGLDLAEIQPRT